MKKNNKNAAKISRYMSEFLYDYAPNFLTYSEHTIRSYKEALSLYVTYLESIGITPNSLDIFHFNKEHIEGWMKWLSNTRNSLPRYLQCQARFIACVFAVSQQQRHRIFVLISGI